MATTNKSVYFTGLGDLYGKVDNPDRPTSTWFDGETTSGVTQTGTVTISLNYSDKQSGASSLSVAGVGAGEGATIPVVYTTGQISPSGFLKVNIKPTTTGNFDFIVNAGTSANSIEITKNLVGGQWNEVILDLANASNITPNPITTTGTPNFTNITGVEIVAVASNDFLVDNINYYSTYNLIGSLLSVIIACIDEMGLDSSYDTKQLRCSDNSIVFTTATSVEHKVSLTGQDFRAETLAFLANGTIDSSNAYKLDDKVKFTVPASAPYQVTLTDPTSVVVSGGFGLWITLDDLTNIQLTTDPTVIPSGYAYYNTATGVLTFNSDMAGKAVYVTANRKLANGYKVVVDNNLTFKEATLQMKVKSSNGKNTLFYFPRIIFDGGLSPETSKDDFWKFSSEGTLLSDPNTAVYYEIHQEN